MDDRHISIERYVGTMNSFLAILPSQMNLFARMRHKKMPIKIKQSINAYPIKIISFYYI